MPSNKRGRSNYLYRSRAEALKRVGKRDQLPCHLCGGKLGPIDYDDKTRGRLAFSADHVESVSKNGNEAKGTLMPSHVTCNSSKGSMSLDDWFEKQKVKEKSEIKPTMLGL